MAIQNGQLEKIKAELQFVGRTLDNGHLDFDTLDELGRSISSALRHINEYEAEQRCFEIAGTPAYRITVFRPVGA